MRLVFRVHAIQRMFERSISKDDVRNVIESGETIRDYPDDTPYPSKLMLGWIDGRPFHLVVATNVTDDEVIVITAYRPDPDIWDQEFRSKRE